MWQNCAKKVDYFFCPIHSALFLNLRIILSTERLGESGATHDSQSASRSGVEARVARNLNGWNESDAGLSQGWVRCPSGLASLHHSRLSTRSPYQFSVQFSGDRCVCYDKRGTFVYDSPNLFCGPSGSLRTGLMGVRSEHGPRTHPTSLIVVSNDWMYSCIHDSDSDQNRKLCPLCRMEVCNKISLDKNLSFR